MVVPRPLVVAGCAALLLLPAPAAAAAPPVSLAAVEPENGETLQRVPAQAVLTFTAEVDPDRTAATVTPPGREPRPAQADVDGDRVHVDLADAGAGAYVVGYEVVPVGAGPEAAPVEGSVGFTVDPGGEPAAAGGVAPWAVASGLAVVGLLAALLVTVRRWQGQR